jgi:hypothetical protein
MKLSRLTSRDQGCTATHDTAHLLAPIAPPTRRRSDVVAQMPLSFVLDVEGEDVVRKILPLWGTGQQCILVLENVRKAVLEVVDWRRILVEESHVILSSWSCSAINNGEFVFRDVSIFVKVLSAN